MKISLFAAPRPARMAAFVLLLAALPLAAHAAPKDHDARLLQLLRGIDTVPTAAALRAVGGANPEGALFRVALDGDLSLYERRRATSLLSMLDADLGERYLTTIPLLVTEPKVRYMAVYTYVRGWATRAPNRALDYAEQTLQSAIELDREAAVRGLRWVPGGRADALLEAAQKHETSPRIQRAIARARQVRGRK